jgi:glycerate kinase
VPRLVVAPDKFRGTATAAEVADTGAAAARSAGWDPVALPLSDGGEGFLDALATPSSVLRSTVVTGPDGGPVEAAWLLDGDRAVVESARASGLALVGGPDGNDALAATSRGTGELLVAAARAVGPGGTVVVGLGGSASTDGGAGLLEAVEAAGGLGGVTVVAACDTLVDFVQAATLYAPQKGAGPADVPTLEGRLAGIAASWRRHRGIDVVDRAGAGAAGGMGGALAVLGAVLRSGYDVVATHVRLRPAIDGADLVVTGEGTVDQTSFTGKVVGGVLDDAEDRDVPVLVVAGRVTVEATAEAAARGVLLVSLVDRFGAARAVGDPAGAAAEMVAGILGG